MSLRRGGLTTGRDKGLDPTLLDKLFEMVRTWMPDVVDRKVQLGRKLRLERLGIPID